MLNISSFNNKKITVIPATKYKIVFVGNQGVGKSSIINRLVYDIFDENDHRPTIGIDFITYSMIYQDKSIKLQLWDTAGQERFRSLIPNYIRDCAVAIIVYDVTNRKSFDSVYGWAKDIRNQRGQNVIIGLIANKIDQEDAREVKVQEGKKLSQAIHARFIEGSAKTGSNIKKFLQQIGYMLPDLNQNTRADKYVPQKKPDRQLESQHFRLTEQWNKVKPETGIKRKKKKKKCF